MTYTPFRMRFGMNKNRAEARIKVIEARTKNLRPWLDKVAEAVAMAERLNFATHGSLVGGWAPLSPEYGSWKHLHRPGMPLLINTGKLAESLTVKNRLVLRMGLTSMTLGSDVNYAHFHQYGTRKMPRRKVLVVPESVVKAMKKDLAMYVVHGRWAS